MSRIFAISKSFVTNTLNYFHVHVDIFIHYASAYNADQPWRFRYIFIFRHAV